MSDYDDYDNQEDGYTASNTEPLFDAVAEGAVDDNTTFNNDDLDLDIADTSNYRTTIVDTSEYDDDDVDDGRPPSSIPIGVTSGSTYVPRGPVDIDSIGGHLGNIIRQTLVLNRGPGRFVGDDFDDEVVDGVPVDNGVDDHEEDEDEEEEEDVGVTTLGGGRDDGYDDGDD